MVKRYINILYYYYYYMKLIITAVTKALYSTLVKSWLKRPKALPHMTFAGYYMKLFFYVFDETWFWQNLFFLHFLHFCIWGKLHLANFIGRNFIWRNFIWRRLDTNGPKHKQTNTHKLLNYIIDMIYPIKLSSIDQPSKNTSPRFVPNKIKILSKINIKEKLF